MGRNIIHTVLKLINYTTVINRDLTPYQLFHNELKPTTTPHKPNLKAYRAIGSYCEVLIPLEKRPKAYKIKAKTEPGRLLTVLKSKTYLVYVPTKNTMIKTPFIKLYELKNPLTLKGVLKLIKIRPLNDIAITKDSTREKISLDLPEIDDIGSSKPITPEAPRSLKPLELPTSEPSKLPAPGPSKPPKPKNRLSEPILRPPEKPIKPIDSSNPDKMQLNLIISLCYRIKAKIFKKKLDKNNSTPNTYKQALKSPNIKKWLTATFNEFEQLISSKTLKFLPYKALLKDKKPLTNRLIF